MRNRDNHTEVQVQKAQEKILGTKFCFACQKDRPLADGKLIQRGKTKTWRCHSCANKQSPMGFKKEAQMTDLRKAAEMALEALKWTTEFMTEQKRLEAWQAMDMLEQALAQPVDAVNMNQDRVDETAKGEHEPWPSVQCVCGGTIYFKYTPPVSDYHEGWEEGFKAATREQEPFIYVREDNEKPFGGFEHCSETDVGAFPVYAAPMLYTPRPKREWVGLTDEEIYDYADKFLYQHGSNYGIKSFGKAIEAKLKEKNGG